jgi:hypothetical protein
MNPAMWQSKQAGPALAEFLMGEVTGFLVGDLIGDSRCPCDDIGIASVKGFGWADRSDRAGLERKEKRGVPRASGRVNEAASQKISPMSREVCISGSAVQTALLRRWE